jgi:hypothetical protein
MKYIAPEVLNSINATELVRGNKQGSSRDSSLEPTGAAGYDSDE